MVVILLEVVIDVDKVVLIMLHVVTEVEKVVVTCDYVGGCH